MLMPSIYKLREKIGESEKKKMCGKNEPSINNKENMYWFYC